MRRGEAQAEEADDHHGDRDPAGREHANPRRHGARKECENDHGESVKRQQKPDRVKIKAFTGEHDGEERGVRIHEGDEEGGARAANIRAGPARR